jgi:hypothetical protein
VEHLYELEFENNLIDELELAGADGDMNLRKSKARRIMRLAAKIAACQPVKRFLTCSMVCRLRR